MTKHHSGGAGGSDSHGGGGSDHQANGGGSDSQSHSGGEGHNFGIHHAVHDAYSPPKISHGDSSPPKHGPPSTHVSDSGSTSGGTKHPTEEGNPTEGGGDNPPPPPPPTDNDDNPPPRDNPPHHRKHHRGGGVLPPLEIVNGPFVRIEADNGNESIIRTSPNGASPSISAPGRPGVTLG